MSVFEEAKNLVKQLPFNLLSSIAGLSGFDWDININMAIIDLNFQIYVHCDVDLNNLKQLFREAWTGTSIEWDQPGSTARTSENYITFKRNPFSDLEKANDPSEGFFYFAYLIEVSSRKETPTENDLKNQVDFARLMIKTLVDLGCRALISSHFEHMM